MSQVTAVLLAGGVGKRLWPMTQDKSLLRFLDKPLIAHTALALRNAGITHVVVVANRQNQKALQELKGGTVVVQKNPLGMGDALLTVRTHIKGSSILVVNAADIVDQKLYEKILQKAQKTSADIIIPGLERKEYFPGGYLRIEGGKVVEVVEKPGKGRRPSNLVNLVAHFFRNANEFLEKIQKTDSKRDDVYEQALSALLKTKKAEVIRYKGPFGWIKYPWDILEMSSLFLRERVSTSSISRKASIHGSAIIEGPVVIESGAKVLEHAVIKGPTYIGANSTIGTSALVLESMIGRNCMVGFASEVSRSYLGNGCWLHTNYIGDSVFEGENYLGAGAVTANFRFDEDNIHSTVEGKRMNTKRTKLGAILGRGARVGVNASLMPGVKIGSGAFVGPGVVQYSDMNAQGRVFIDRALVRESIRKKKNDQ